MMPTYLQLPDLVSGYVLNPQRGCLSVVVPEATTNLVTNPSFELPTGAAASPTGYAAVGAATIIQTTAQQRRGRLGCQVTPSAAQTSSGVSWALTLAAQTAHTFSADLSGAPGDLYELRIVDVTAGTTLASVRVTGAGRWRRHSITATTSANTSYRLELVRYDPDSAKSTLVFVTDGWQCEAKAYATTYCDGDQAGFVRGQAPPAYYWTGVAHASTSTRSAQTRAGGRAVSIQETYGLLITGIQGLGLPEPTIVQTPYALRDGASYQRSVTPPRTFTVTGQFGARSPQQLARLRGDLAAVLSPGAVALDQPLLLLYQDTACNDLVGDEVALPCVYAGGLERDGTSLHGERVAIRCVMPDPALRSSSEQAASLTLNAAVSGPENIIERTPDGAYTAVDGGTNAGDVWAVAYDSQYLYAGGSAISWGNPAVTANRIARYDPATDTWTALGSGVSNGVNNEVRAIAVGPDGQIYIGGLFTQNSGATVTYNYVARWNGATWSALAAGLPSAVYRLAFAPGGTLYAATQSNGVYSWNGTAWSAVGALGGTGWSVIVSANGTLYAGTDAGVSQWTGSAWVSIGAITGAGSPLVRTLRFGPGGLLVAGGSFATIGGVSAANIAAWNGASWAPLGSGTDDEVYEVAVQPQTGELYAVGEFVTAGGVSAQKVAVWNGATWRPIDVRFTSLPNYIGGAAFRSDGRLALGGLNIANATVSGTATVTNSGTAGAAPVLDLTGPMTLVQLRNDTTGQAIYATVTLLAGETARLDLTPGQLSFTSSFQGNLIGALVLAPLELAPGANTIRALGYGTTAASAATLRWRPTYASIDDATE